MQFLIGDHEGIGEIRAQELWGSCKKLGIKPGNVVCFNHHYLRDDPEVLWKPSHIAGILTQSVHALDIDTVREIFTLVYYCLWKIGI